MQHRASPHVLKYYKPSFHQRGNLQAHVPEWMAAVRLHPPEGNSVRGIDPTMVFKPVKEESRHGGSRAGRSSAPQQSAGYAGSSNRSTSKIHIPFRAESLRLARTLFHKRRDLTPPVISYPEDEIRRRFYEEHPFELLRGTTLGEDGEQSVRESVRDWQRGKVGEQDGEATAESAIRHALHLHTRDNLPLSVAYSTAVHAFRLARAREEHAARAKELAEYGQVDADAQAPEGVGDSNRTLRELFKARPRPATKKFLEWEDREVEKAREADRIKKAELDARRAQTEQMAQFDSAGTKSAAASGAGASAAGGR
ncbi:hypothetical protein M427DRAFT_473454 [Gonapodya prolifera JEL478]|uniref:Small ribosomal subunit protein mS23 n=1 Tax=Gonapodya prolifera (strain JEL478) TaxID=1344416 RepID=A0A139ARL0_GONPJ|nr:hypothetical protein M427DRAFT_473454 [Gonapodya prolifera JEL478]|eukprot:KXS19294.1 hypothetical protein M427DRAFT_473454 [Gonapodya prolifera JEL478]